MSLIAAYALAAALAAPASPTTALTSAQAAPAAPTAPAPAPAGLPIAAVVDWLKAQGLSVGEVQGGDSPYVQVRESADLTWTVTFNSCAGQVCGDLQFGAGFSNPDVTIDKVNAWNGQRRFVKAFYEAPAGARTDGAAIIQQDVILLAGIGPSQLTDSLAVWRSLLPAFAFHVGYFVEGAPAQPAG